MSYLSQMTALVIHNFFSAAVGIAAAVAVIRGIASRGKASLGNFWADFVRCNLYILLPICFIYAIFMVSQGTIQNFKPYIEATTLEGVKQLIAMGPVASQVAIKMLGTNGGGFFNANAAHPFENPTALSNFIQMLSMFLIPSGLVYLLGRKVNSSKHAWSVWAAMAVLFIVGVLVAAHAEYRGNPLLTRLGCSAPLNMEGKEMRFGIFDSALWATITTDTSCGAVNSMHDSFTPLGGLVPLFNIKLGEVVFGGVGSGLYTMVLFIVLTIFISGLMVGRTPEYLGKKIEGREVKYAMLALIVGALSILCFSAWASLDYRGLAGLSNAGPHGLITEDRADHLRLPPMTQQNSSRFGTAFTESIEAREGVTTGISAADRARTIRTAIDPGSTSADLVRPGHVFPLRARRGGVLVRAGQTEASVDLARLAGLTPAGVICEIMRDDGAMARIPDLIPFCREHGLRMITVAELIRYRLRNERYIVRAGETRVQTRYGEFRMIAYESQVQGGESHIALIRGDLCPDCPAFHAGSAPAPVTNGLHDGSAAASITPSAEPRPVCPHPVFVRVHTRCTAGDVFSADCHCREILDQSMRAIRN